MHKKNNVRFGTKLYININYIGFFFSLNPGSLYPPEFSLYTGKYLIIKFSCYYTLSCISYQNLLDRNKMKGTCIFCVYDRDKTIPPLLKLLNITEVWQLGSKKCGILTTHITVLQLVSVPQLAC